MRLQVLTLRLKIIIIRLMKMLLLLNGDHFGCWNWRREDKEDDYLKVKIVEFPVCYKGIVITASQF